MNSKNRLIKSLDETIKYKDNTILYLGVDKDDPTIKETHQLAKDYKFVKIIEIENNGEFLGLGKLWNVMMESVPDDVLAMVGDDMVFETKDWDEKILNDFSSEKLPNDKFLMVHCNDGMRGPNNIYPDVQPFPVNSFIHRSYYDTFGYYVREEWKHGFHDNWINDIYTAVDRKKYYHDIMIRHLHWSDNSNDTKLDNVSAVLEENYKKGQTIISYGDPKLIEIRKNEIEKINQLKEECKIKLSILIPTLENRKHFLDRLMECLNKQDLTDVEILTELDNGEKSIGEKRNILLDRATGDYIAFVDDDDLVSEKYVELVLKAIEKKPDVVGMHLLMTVDGQREERTYHSLKYRTWYNENDPDRPGKQRYFRNPNHLNPVKREYAVKTRFPSINMCEDRDYSARILPYLQTEEYIEEPIYYYLVRSSK
jgi:hypothetical protein